MNRLELLPETGFLRLSTVLRVFPVSKSTWWAGVKIGKFPKPIKLTERTTAWKAEDIRELIKTRNQQR
jgi:prophage regulatory protein